MYCELKKVVYLLILECMLVISWKEGILLVMMSDGSHVAATECFKRRRKGYLFFLLSPLPSPQKILTISNICILIDKFNLQQSMEAYMYVQI